MLVNTEPTLYATIMVRFCSFLHVLLFCSFLGGCILGFH